MDEYDNFANVVTCNHGQLEAIAGIHAIRRRFSIVEIEGYVYSDGFLAQEGWHESDAMLRTRMNAAMNMEA